MNEHLRADTRRSLLFVVLSWVAMLLPPIGPGQSRSAAPPIAGQTALFDGAVGSYRATMRVAPAEVHVEEPLILTVRLAAAEPGPPPRRPDLRRRPAFHNRFFVERAGPQVGPGPDRTLPDGSTWEFDYTLRPKSTNVTAIPAFRFDYYKPGFLPEEKGYQTSWAHGLPLTVTARVRPTLAQLVDLPADFHRWADEAHVLAHVSPWRGPALWGLAAWLLMPPLACMIGYAAWQAVDPAAFQRAWPGRSRAARRALRALRRIQSSVDADSWIEAGTVFSRYLGQRFPWLTADNGLGVEVLETKNVPAGLADRVRAFLQALDAVRYGPAIDLPSDPPAVMASALIRDLEDQPWRP